MPKMIRLNPQLSAEERNNIAQAVANVALEGMLPTEQCIRDMEAVSLGLKTEEQMMQETIRRYQK